MKERGWTTIAVHVSPPSKEKPKGGVYNRLEKLLQYRKEPWNDALERILDELDEMRKRADDGK
jgi:hypothetical protein